MNKKILLIGCIILGLILIALSLKLFSNEDDWICQNGQWVKHGHPSAPKPIEPCD